MQNDRVKFKNDFKKRLYAFTLSLIHFVGSLPKTMASDIMGKQLLRSGTSIIANYIEASAASSKKDFINFFTHALKSANESKVWLSLLKDSRQSDSKETAVLLKECVEIANVLASSILTMKNKK